MNKGISTIATLLTTGILAFGGVVGAYFTGGASGERRAHTIELALTQQISKETSERSVAITKLEGQFDVVNEKIDTQTRLIVELMDGLGIKYSLPKAETFSTKAEQMKKAPLITGSKNGIPQNETEN